MQLEVLLERAKEIETALVNIANQHQMLIGHKTEINHWIAQAQEANKETCETKVDEPVASEEVLPVE